MPVRVDQKDLEAVAEADDGDEADDAAFEPEMAGQIEGEDGEDEHGGEKAGKKEDRRSGEAVDEQSRAEEKV